METLGTVLISAAALIVVLGTLVLTHELGHYLAAKLLGFGVVAFSIGMGPLLWQRRGKKEAFTLEIADLDHAELDHGPLRFFEKGKEMPKAVRIDDYEMAGVILTNLLQR